ncbi:MAG: RiPP maturation radical SAM protein 1 [Planctomycetaceae bacterium]|nr:RiPP maturation radical SAM protein 1 [Planctomycetaceae bacterium]
MTENNSNGGEVVLVRMPWDILERPSASFGLIVPVLRRAGIAPRVVYPDFWMAERLGLSTYQRMSSGAGWTLIGEFAFSKTAFPQEFPHATTEVIDGFPAPQVAMIKQALGEDYREVLSGIRDEHAPAICDQLAEDCRDAAVVGFTCTINQLVAALAAARAIKRRNPRARILLGGAQVEGVMGDEVLRVAPWVDAVYKGEAELGVVQTVRYLRGEVAEPPRDYVSYRQANGELHFASRGAQVQDLDALPFPEFDQYFAQLERARGTRAEVQCNQVPFVSSRGCWWGEIQHCTFCGLNGEGMAYRAKSPDRVVDELVALAARYGRLTLVGMDNIIPHAYLKSVLPRLRDNDLDLELLYETKANLKREDVKLYRAAGLKLVQPGIESLSDNTLSLMRKGVTAIQNVYLLKLASQYGVRLQWNVLCGFPGERPEDYEAQIELFPKLAHLPAPQGATWFGLQRFSPFHFEPEKLGVENVRALSSYAYVFPPGAADIEKLAFYFSFDYVGGHGIPDELKLALRRATRRWTKRVRQPGRRAALVYLRGPGFIEVRDSREPGRVRVHKLTGLEMELFAACDDIQSLRALRTRFSGAPQVDEAIAGLQAVGLVLCDGHRVLNLALPASTKDVRHRVETPECGPDEVDSDLQGTRERDELAEWGHDRDALDAVRSGSQLY